MRKRAQMSSSLMFVQADHIRMAYQRRDGDVWKATSQKQTEATAARWQQKSDGAARAEALDGTLRLERALAVALEARPLICAVNARKQDFVAEKTALYCRVETGRAFKPINVGRRPRESMSLSLRKLRHYRVGSPHDATVCIGDPSRAILMCRSLRPPPKPQDTNGFAEG